MSDAGLPAIPPEVRARIEHDPWARSLGIEFLDVRKGYARLALTLQPQMVNHQGYPHGAVIFALADTAFSAACNSHGQPAVALNVTISFLSAPKPGARLVAEGREVRQGRRAGFYDINVSTEDGTAVAFAHCVAHRVASSG